MGARGVWRWAQGFWFAARRKSGFGHSREKHTDFARKSVGRDSLLKSFHEVSTHVSTGVAGEVSEQGLQGRF